MELEEILTKEYPKYSFLGLFEKLQKYTKYRYIYTNKKTKEVRYTDWYLRGIDVKPKDFGLASWLWKTNIETDEPKEEFYTWNIN